MKQNIKIAKSLVKLAKSIIAGHQIYLREFPQKTTLKEIKKDIDDNMLNVYDPYETSYGMPSNLKLFNKVCEDRNEAQRFVDGYSHHYQDCGVLFKSPIKNDRSQKKYELAFKKLKQKKEKAIKMLMKGFAKCKNCNSKINLEYVGINQSVRVVCPVCTGRFDYDEKKVLIDFEKQEKIVKINEEIRKLREMYEQELKQGKYELKWLVQADRHV